MSTIFGADVQRVQAGRGAKRGGGFKRGGFPVRTLSILFCPCWDFPFFLFFRDFQWMSSEIFTICPFPLLVYPPEKIHPQKKRSSEQVFLNNFRWAPDSCHREEGKGSPEVFGKSSCERGNFIVFSDLGWALGPRINSAYKGQSRKRPRHNPDLPQKQVGNPQLEPPRFSFSQVAEKLCTESILGCTPKGAYGNAAF